jgi:GNAT superfamily N-acetyltransferase
MPDTMEQQQGSVIFPFADHALAERLERAEAVGNARFVEARARVSPESGAAWIDVGGTYAMFDGVDSPVTQTFGFGLFSAALPVGLNTIEQFFRSKRAPFCHEICPLADPAHGGLLSERGYQPIEFSSVMYQPIRAALDITAARDSKIRVRTVDERDQNVWARTAAEGWSETPGIETFLLEMGRVTAARVDAVMFLAEDEGDGGRPIATATMSIWEGVALFAGASTIPAARHRGAQFALLAQRLSYAAAHGCDLAMMVAMSGSGSQRNAERNGFRIAYTRTKWRKTLE